MSPNFFYEIQRGKVGYSRWHITAACPFKKRACTKSSKRCYLSLLQWEGLHLQSACLWVCSCTYMESPKACDWVIPWRTFRPISLLSLDLLFELMLSWCWILKELKLNIKKTSVLNPKAFTLSLLLLSRDVWYLKMVSANRKYAQKQYVKSMWSYLVSPVKRQTFFYF